MTKIWEAVNYEKVTRYLLVVPVVLALVFVVLFPLIFNLRLSFTNANFSNYINPSFIGIRNYTDLFHLNAFWNSVRFTLIFVSIAVTLELVMGVATALLIHLNDIKWKGLYITLIISPLMIAPIFYGVAFKLGLNSIYGVLPYYLNIEPLQNITSATISLVLVDLLRWFPFIFLITYAGLQALPAQLLESAKIDGATVLQLIYYVVIPMSKSVIAIAAVFRMIDSLKIFGLIYMLTGGGPGIGTRSVSVQIYYYNFAQFNFGLASAFTFLVLLMVAPLIWFANKKLVL